MSTHIDQLKELTGRLPPSLGDLAETLGTVRVYLTEIGRMVGVGLYYGCDVAVARIMALAGTVLPKHVHREQHEWLGIIRGAAIFTVFTVDGVESHRVKLTEGESIHFKPGEAHITEYTEDTTLWALSMPPAEGFPPPGCP